MAAKTGQSKLTTMQCTLEQDGAVLVIRIPFSPKGSASTSGKSRLHASTHGFQASTVAVEGRPVRVSLNAIS